MYHLLDPPKNVSHFQRVEAAGIYLYDFDYYAKISFWEAVSQLGAGIPSSDTQDKRACWGVETTTIANRSYLYGSQGRQDNLQE